MRTLLILLALVLAWLILRYFWRRSRLVQPGGHTPGQVQETLRCTQCETFVPKAQALMHKGLPFCSPGCLQRHDRSS
jgi:hypothetical protein